MGSSMLKIDRQKSESFLFDPSRRAVTHGTRIHNECSRLVGGEQCGLLDKPHFSRRAARI